MRKLISIKLVMLMVLSGCGVKGPLYQTPEQQPVEQVEDTEQNQTNKSNQ